jgi:hypothetical protein
MKVGCSLLADNEPHHDTCNCKRDSSEGNPTHEALLPLNPGQLFAHHFVVFMGWESHATLAVHDLAKDARPA